MFIEDSHMWTVYIVLSASNALEVPKQVVLDMSQKS